MNGKDLFLGMNYVKAKFIDEAETVTELKGERKAMSFRKAVLIAAVIALLAVTITACAYAIQRIKMNLVQHNVPVETEVIVPDIEYPDETMPVNILTDYYPQILPEGYTILSGSPTSHTARSIVYQNENGRSIHFQISTIPQEHDIALRPPVEESVINFSCGEATYLKNEDAQVLIWHDEQEGYDASLFTDDINVDLISMADSMGYGNSIPLSIWYHRGEEWNPWYPQVLPEGYTCIDVTPVSNGYQTFTYENGNDGYIRYGVSTQRDLAPAEISDQGYWEEVEVNGVPARMKRNQSTQRTLFWHNETEGFYAFLETMDDTVDLEALAESIGPGSKMEVSISWLGPDYTLELEQEPSVYVEWQSIYPQNIPDGYELEHVGTRAYGQQLIEWMNSEGDAITYTLYFRLGQYELQFDGIGQPEPVSINGLAGFKTGNSLLWADGKLGFGYELRVTGDVDLIALAESVGPGPELTLTNDKTSAALAELGDYQITELPDNVVEDGLSGAPLEDGDDWYSYVRRWYYDRTNNNHVYFTYETYLTDCTNMEDRLRMLISLSMTSEPEFMTINGYPGITIQDGDRAKVAWVIGDVNKGVSFQLYSEQFTVEDLLNMAESVHKK